MTANPRLLGIETSAEACSVAVYSDGETQVFFERAPKRHAELLLPAVKQLLEQSGVKLETLDAIAFGRGPGSFTSLRIGIGVVQGLAWGTGLPVVPVSSLAAVAQLAVDSSPLGLSTVCVATDARMKEVYTANFTRGADGLVAVSGEEQVCAPDHVTAPRDGRFIVAGNGFERFTELGGLAGQAAESYPELEARAEMICKLAVNWLKHHDPLPAGMAQPVYVRNNVADKPAKSG